MTDPADPTAEDPSPDPSSGPSSDPTPDPTPDPTSGPAPDPTSEPSEADPEDRDPDARDAGEPAGAEPAAPDPGEDAGGRGRADGGDVSGQHAAGAAGRPDTSSSSVSVDDAGEELPGSALAAVARGGGPPRPPKRTGVFVDDEDLRHYVGGLLRAILGGYEVDAFGNFTFAHEGARVFVTVGASPIGPQVGVFSVTNLDVDLTPDLAGFLLTTNHKLGFGSFSYDTDNRSVWLRHTLLGTTLDGPELQSAVAAVATTAAGLDHTIRDRFGGRTFADAPEQMQRGVEPPRPEDDPGPPNASGYL